jgi:hypothetical protein
VAADIIGNREQMTFEQAEGAHPLPQQLRPKEISQKLRSYLWFIFYNAIWDSSDSGGYLTDPWHRILRDLHVFHYHQMIDDYDSRLKVQVQAVKNVITKGNYIDVLGFTQAVIRHGVCPRETREAIRSALESSRAAYTLIEGRTIVPKATDQEVKTLERAFADVKGAQFIGAREHLRNAAERLTGGKYADSVRESIHAVESVARVLEPSADLSKALARLEATSQVHGALKQGFLRLYGYTSDEQGVRHALLDGSSPNVDETDALFMIGACASFVSYLINKAERVALLK